MVIREKNTPMSDNEGYLMTQSSLDRLREKLRQLEQKRLTIGQDIGDAAESGTWHDNFAFEQGHRDHDFVNAQIAEIRNQISNAKIIKPNHDKDKVGIGHTIEVETTETGRTNLTILGPQDSAPENGIISYETPVAKRMLGRKKGDTIKLGRGDDSDETATIIDFKPGKFK
jgi:transcription elongation factor GreA